MQRDRNQCILTLVNPGEPSDNLNLCLERRMLLGRHERRLSGGAGDLICYPVPQ